MARPPDQPEYPPSDAQQKADRLHDLLATKLPLDAHPGAPCSQYRAGLPRSITWVLSETLEHDLLSEDPLLATLKRIKTYATESSRAASSPVDQEPAHVLYYAAIARALLSHDQRITAFSLEELGRSFVQFSKLPWLTTALMQLFAQAGKTCRSSPSAKGDVHQP